MVFFSTTIRAIVKYDRDTNSWQIVVDQIPCDPAEWKTHEWGVQNCVFVVVEENIFILGGRAGAWNSSELRIMNTFNVNTGKWLSDTKEIGERYLPRAIMNANTCTIPDFGGENESMIRYAGDNWW